MAPNVVIFGVPKELKQDEYRVGMTPTTVLHVIDHSARVLVERGAGEGSGFSDSEYEAAGAELVDVETLFEKSDIVVKIKEPLPEEFGRIRRHQAIFTFFHFAGIPGLAEAMRERGAMCVAYEQVQRDDGSLPILAPMSEIAGKLAIQEGMRLLDKVHGGRGILLGGVVGVPACTVAVIGCGVAGSTAARTAAALGARVVLLDKDMVRLRNIVPTFHGHVSTLFATPEQIAQTLEEADLVIGAALVPGAHAPRLITEAMIRRMKKGAVFIDISIDQGGITEISHPTSHKSPTYMTETGQVFYCVANMPGIVPRTATEAINCSTLPYLEDMAVKGFKKAVEESRELRRGFVQL